MKTKIFLIPIIFLILSSIVMADLQPTPWSFLFNFPTSCNANQYVSGVGKTLTCQNSTGLNISAGSGTTNYVAKWDTTSTLTNSAITDDGQNLTVGNGNTTALKLNSTTMILGNGNTTIMSVTNTSILLGTNLNLSGNNISGISTMDDYTSGLITFLPNITINGILNVLNQISNLLNLNVTGNVTIGTNLNITNNLGITNNATISGTTTTGNLNVGNNTDLVVDSGTHTITINGSVTFRYPNVNVNKFVQNGTFVIINSVGVGNGLANTSQSGNNLRVNPFISQANTSFDEIGFLSTMTNTSLACMVGIYNDTGATYPSTLITNSSSFTQTGSNLYQNTSLSANVTLKENTLYWVAYWCNATTSLRTVQSVDVPAVLGYTLPYIDSQATMGYSWTTTYNTSGFNKTLPAGGGNGATTSINPAIIIRVRK